MTPHILLWSPLDDYLADMLAALPAIRFSRVRSEAELAEALPDADGIVMLGHFYTAGTAALVRQAGRRLRWIQLTTAGYDGITFYGVPDTVMVTNAGHSHAPMVAEHAVTLLATLTQRLHLYAEPQARHVFDRGIALPPATLEDSTVAILGYGGIGRETARRVKAFGARVVAVARTARGDDLADAVVASSDLHTVLEQADSLVVTAALTPQTRGMIGHAALAAMQPGGLLVNVARGAIVDTVALVAALNSGHLAGAGLGSAAVRRRIAALVGENVGRFIAGEALLHRVA
jgi:phosphoglycerate dehydrogenase-like enzyme